MFFGRKGAISAALAGSLLGCSYRSWDVLRTRRILCLARGFLILGLRWKLRHRSQLCLL